MNINGSNNGKWFQTKKKSRSRQYPIETITDADYADDLALLTNTTVQAKSSLFILEQAVSSIGLYVNSDKTDFMGFNQNLIYWKQTHTWLKYGLPLTG